MKHDFFLFNYQTFDIAVVQTKIEAHSKKKKKRKLGYLVLLSLQPCNEVKKPTKYLEMFIDAAVIYKAIKVRSLPEC